MRHTDPRSLPRTVWPVADRAELPSTGPAEVPVWDRQEPIDISDVMARSRVERAHAMKSFFGWLRTLARERFRLGGMSTSFKHAR